MDAVVLMTRVPVPGKTKTRLSGILTPYQCAGIHRAFLKDIISACREVPADLYISYGEEGPFEMIEDLVPEETGVFLQEGRGLGERMKNSLSRIIKIGYKKVVLIGSDIPEVESSNIIKAFEILKEKEVVLGPSFDGGYYLVGMKKLNEIIFSKDIKWGGGSVLEATVKFLSSRDIKTGFTYPCHDIDIEEDLLSFIKRAEEFSRERCRNTREYIFENIGGAYYERDI